MLDQPETLLPKRSITLLFLALVLNLAACDQIQQKMGFEDLAAKEARLEAEGKAVGGGCRHSGRAIEDCYSIYNWLPKAPVFAGWRDMDAYMRDNKLETIEPVLPPPQSPENSRKKRAKEESSSYSKTSLKESKEAKETKETKAVEKAH